MSTPAPWTAGITFNPKSPRPNVIVWSGSKPMVSVARDVAAVDASLICAAPDLLAACELMLSTDDPAVLDVARAAIRKARNT